MKISKAKLKQIIKEELDLAMDDDTMGDDELKAILDKPILEGTLMEIVPGAADAVVTGVGIGLGVILAWFALNGMATAAVLAHEALRTYVNRKKAKEYQDAARQVQEREQSLLNTLVEDPEITAILDKHNGLADYLGKKGGQRSKELQGQRAELKQLAADLRNKIEARAVELQDEIGGHVPRPGKKRVQQHRDRKVLDPQGLRNK